MRNLIREFFILVLFAAGCGKGSPNPSSQISTAKIGNKYDILGGHETPTLEAESSGIVAIFNRKNLGSSICTGILIAPNAVLSAAHCFKDPGKGYVVFHKDVFSFHDIARSSVARKIISVKIHPVYTNYHKIINHPDFRKMTDEYIQDKKINRGSSKSDDTKFIGLLQKLIERLSIEIPDTQMQKMILDTILNGRNRGDLAVAHFEGSAPQNYKIIHKFSDEKLVTNTHALMAYGFGTINAAPVEFDMSEGILREVKVRLLDWKFSRSEFTLEQGAEGVCRGDSGGPIFIYENGEMHLLGITSRGVGKLCNEGSIHTKIINYLSWIQDSLAH